MREFMRVDCLLAAVLLLAGCGADKPKVFVDQGKPTLPCNMGDMYADPRTGEAYTCLGTIEIKTEWRKAK